MTNTQPTHPEPTAAQVEHCQARLTDLASSYPYAAPEVAPRFQAEAAECLNTIARYFGLRGSQSAPGAEVQPRPVVQRFALLMEEVLRVNDHKTGWLNDHSLDLFARLREEVDELDQALDGAPVARVMREAADVANFAMMIADKADWKLGNGREVAS